WEEEEIPSPSDTLYVEGGFKLINGETKILFRDFLESEKVMNELPATSAMIKYRLNIDEKQGRIPDQPITEYKDLSLDYVRWDQYVRGTPKWFKRYVAEYPGDMIAANLFKRFEREVEVGFMDRHDPTALIYQYFEAYANSAGGGNPERLGAVTGANFEI